MIKFLSRTFLLSLLLLTHSFPLSAQPSTIPSSQTSPPNIQTQQIQNQLIKIIVNDMPNDKGRFAIETIQGNPSTTNDDHQSLIYGRPIPWTSYSTLLIDEQPFVFGNPSEKLKKRSKHPFKYLPITHQSKHSQEIISHANTTSINISQSLSFFQNPFTRLKDAVLISYTVTNTDHIPHQVGLRIMLDTMLGKNDGSPFRIGEHAHTNEITYSQSELQDYWQTFDQLSSPNIIAQGLLHLPEKGILKPDELTLSNWGSLVDAPWEFKYKKGRPFIRTGENEADTAIALRWDPQTILPKETRTFKTVYGLGGITLQAGELSLGISAPSEISVTHDPFLIMAYISNTSQLDAPNTKVTLQLPAGIQVLSGKQTQTIKSLPKGQTIQVPLIVQPNSKTRAKTTHIKLMVQSQLLENNQLKRPLSILPSQPLESQLTITPISSTHYQANLILKNPSQFNTKPLTATLKTPPPLKIAAFDLAQKNIQAIPANGQKELNWVFSATNNPSTSKNIRCEITSQKTQIQAVHATFPSLPNTPYFESRRHQKPIKKGDLFFTSISLKNAFKTTSLTGHIQYDPTHLKLTRISPEPWLYTSKQTPHIITQPGSISLQQLSIPKSSELLPLIKCHFKALKEGPTYVKIRSSDIPELSHHIIVTKEKPNSSHSGGPL